MMTVTIQLQKPDGSLIGIFPAEDHQSIAQMARTNNINLPTSCGMGACGICRCKILAGNEYVQIDKISTPLVSPARNQDGGFNEVFSCVGGIHSEAINDQNIHQVILEKNL